MKLKIILALAAIAATLGTGGCKPKEITGQVFIASGGMSFRLGAVEVQLIEKQQVVDFLKRQQTSIETEVELRKGALADAQEKVEKIQSEVEQAQLRYDLFLINKPWLTNAVYLKLEKEQRRLQGLEVQFEKASNAAPTAGGQQYNLRNQAGAYHNAAIRIEDQKTQVKNAMTGAQLSF